MVLLARDGAIFCSTAAMVPRVMATSRISEMPFLGSITWPPFSSRSYWLCAPAQDARIRRKVDRMVCSPSRRCAPRLVYRRGRGDDQFLTGLDGYGSANGAEAGARITS